MSRYPIIPSAEERLAEEVRATVLLTNRPTVYCEYCKHSHAEGFYDDCNAAARSPSSAPSETHK